MTHNWRPFTSQALTLMREALELKYAALRVDLSKNKPERNLVGDLLDDIEREQAKR